RDDSGLHIERRDTTDREPVTPMAVRHTEGIPPDPWQTSDIRNLVKYPLIHRLQNSLCGIDTGRHQHTWFLRRRNLPDFIGHTVHPYVGIQLHIGFESHIVVMEYAAIPPYPGITNCPSLRHPVPLLPSNFLRSVATHRDVSSRLLCRCATLETADQPGRRSNR